MFHSKHVTVGVIAILIVFQPELRRILEYIGNNKFLKSNVAEDDKLKGNDAIDDIVRASYSLGEKRIGALIVLEKQTGLMDYVETGISLNSDVSYELLMNIFIPNTPLHDGAVIISKGIILAASCFLPLTDNKAISMELGTRHRAGLGISEKSDAIVIVVSEETGFISICEKGKLSRNVERSYLQEYLLKSFTFTDRINTISIKETFQSFFTKVMSDNEVIVNEDSEHKIKEKIKKEVKEELMEDIKEEVNEIIENQGDSVEK